jgi:hypothetical protein
MLAAMHRQTIFRGMARYYDLIFSWKDYRREAATIQRLIGRYKRSTGMVTYGDDDIKVARLNVSQVRGKQYVRDGHAPSGCGTGWEGQAFCGTARAGDV